MPPRIRNILFLCTGNSARSILAEALVNHLPACAGRFRAFSAGSFPVGRVNPFALALLQDLHMNTRELRSKSWDEFSGADAPALDFIFTVCDSAAGEQCPLWPGRPITAHWGLPDPAAVTGDDALKRAAFAATLQALQRRIEAFARLPLESLDAHQLQQALREIGTA